jgi:hypothetical protein
MPPPFPPLAAITGAEATAMPTTKINAASNFVRQILVIFNPLNRTTSP